MEEDNFHKVILSNPQYKKLALNNAYFNQAIHMLMQDDSCKQTIGIIAELAKQIVEYQDRWQTAQNVINDRSLYNQHLK